MNIEQSINTLTLKQVVIIAAVLALMYLLWVNKELIQAKLNQP